MNRYILHLVNNTIQRACFLLFLLGFFLVGCQQDDNSPVGNGNNMSSNSQPCNEVASCPTWYPVEIGNEWKWNSILGTFRVRITGDTTMNGRTYFTSQFVGGTILTFLNEWCWIYGYTNSNGDLREYDPQSGSDWLYLPGNPVVGQSWNRQGDEWEVLSVNESLQTNSCSYTDLLKVQVTDAIDGSQSHVYYGRGLGLVYCADATNSTISYYLQEVKVRW